MSNNSKLVGALILGAAAGAAISLFLTSEKGGQFRQLVADKAGDILNDLKEKAVEGKSFVSSFADKVTTVSEDLAKKAANSVNTVATAAKTGSNMYI